MAALALCACAGIALLAGAPANAQNLYDSVRHTLDLAPDPIERSPRLVGMGRLTLADDIHNRITLWDFAQNPTGVLEADSGSTMELRPATAARSGTYLLSGGGEREYTAARELRLGYEAWNREAGTNAFGIYGDYGALRRDRPYSDDLSVTGTYQVPSMIGIINGHMPYLFTDRMMFSVRAVYKYESDADDYHTIFTNPTGEYLSNPGVLVAPPNFFVPDEVTASTLGGGAGVSYRFGPGLVAAANLDGFSTHIEGANEQARYFTGTGEDRPYVLGQGTIIARTGGLEIGADGRVWRSDSRADWVHTLAGGIGQLPFSGRGRLYARSEEGSTLRTRARWLLDALELGASYRTAYRQIEIDAPDPSDQTSFNYFRNTATYRVGLDSLALPDSILDGTAEQRDWELVGGGTFHLPRTWGLVGAEFHMLRQRLDQTGAGEGPARQMWDARFGYERVCTPILISRLGYIFRDDDADALTRDNELTSQTVTAGLGLRPPGTTWTFDMSYGFEWLNADFGTPYSPRETRQQATAQVRWIF